MADVVITFKIMPESPEIDLNLIKEKVKGIISDFGGEVGRESEEPIGFGLIALNLIFVMDENKGSTEVLEAQISALEEVASVEVTDVRRAIG